MEKLCPIDTPESQKPKEALQPLAAALLESAEWQQLNNTEEMTAEAAQKLASAQATRAEQLVPFLQGYGDDADNKPQPASEQLTDRESALYRDALAASYIQKLEAQGIELSDVELVANGVPLSDELSKSEQRRLLLPIEHALQAAEHEQQENEKNEVPEENSISASTAAFVGKTAIGSDGDGTQKVMWGNKRQQVSVTSRWSRKYDQTAQAA